MINALAASQRLLLPVQTDYLAIKGLERMAHTLAMVVRARGREVAWTVVPTMFDAASEAAASGLRALLRAFEDRVGDTVIPLDNSLPRGQPARRAALAVRVRQPWRTFLPRAARQPRARSRSRSPQRRLGPAA